MAKTRVKLNSAGMAALLKDGGVRAELEGRMARVLDTARATAPVASGAYRDSLEMVAEDHRLLTVVHVQSTAPHAMTVEAGHGTLSRALDTAGGG